MLCHRSVIYGQPTSGTKRVYDSRIPPPVHMHLTFSERPMVRRCHLKVQQPANNPVILPYSRPTGMYAVYLKEFQSRAMTASYLM
jgi:hypothetical protein